MLLRIGRRRRYPDEQLERHYHRSRTCKPSLQRTPWTGTDLAVSSYSMALIDQTVHENRIYSLKITCGPSYPDVRPEVQFLSRVNLPFVNQTNGKVDYAKLPVLANWSRQLSIEHVLVEIRKYVSISVRISCL